MKLTRQLPNRAVSLAILVALTACASKPNTAQRPAAPPELQSSHVTSPVGLLFAGMDENGDAIVTQDEFGAGVSRIFEFGDQDRSEEISPVEFSQWSEAYLGQTYTVPSHLHFDHDQDAQISREEFGFTLDEIWNRFDKNRDGQLVRSEMIVELNLPNSPANMDAMRRQIEAEMRRKMEDAMRRRR